MRITGLVEIVNVTGLSLCRRLQMLYIGAHRVCALESSSYLQFSLQFNMSTNLFDEVQALCIIHPFNVSPVNPFPIILYNKLHALLQSDAGKDRDTTNGGANKK